MLYSSEMSKVSGCKSHICGVKCDGASFFGLSLSNISNGKSVQGSACPTPRAPLPFSKVKASDFSSCIDEENLQVDEMSFTYRKQQ